MHRLAARAAQTLRERNHLVAGDRAVQTNRHDAVDPAIDDSRRRRRDRRGGRQNRFDRFVGVARGMRRLRGFASLAGVAIFAGRRRMTRFGFGHAFSFRIAVRRDRFGLDIGRRIERRGGGPAEGRFDAR